MLSGDKQTSQDSGRFGFLHKNAKQKNAIRKQRSIQNTESTVQCFIIRDLF